MRDYLKEVPGHEAIYERIKNLSGTDLELYIADLFKPFEGLGWKVWMTPVRDYGADLVLDNPDGYRHIFQCKHREDGERSEDIKAVQEVVAAKAFYKAQKAIVITSAENYTSSAEELARANEVVLWRRLQIGTLYVASIHRDEALLADIGLVVPKRTSPTFEQPKKQPSPSPFVHKMESIEEPDLPNLQRSKDKTVRDRFLWLSIIAITAILGLATFLFVRLSSPKGILTSKLPSDTELLHFVEAHDQAWKNAQGSNEARLLLPFRTSKAFTDAQNGILSRARRGCYIAITINAPPEILVQVRAFSHIEMQIQKNWTSYEVCDKRNWTLHLNGPFKVFYRLEPSSKGWKIVEAREVKE